MSLSLILSVVSLLLLQVDSYILKVANDWALHQQCIGMNGGQDFGRRAQSSVLLVTENAPDSSVLLGNVSIVVFELEDEKLGGVETPNGKEYYCNFDNVAAGLCAPEQMGEFLVTKDARAAATNPIVTRNWPLDQPMFVSYQVNQPGYFCVASFSPTRSTFSLTMSITNQGHRLPAFRQRTLDIYRWLAPISLSLLAVWNNMWAIQRRLSAPVSIHALGWLTVIAIAARWVALDWFDQHITDTNSLSRLLASTNCLFVIQTILLFAAAVRSVGLHLETKLPTTTTFIVGGAFTLCSAVASAIDAKVKDSDRSPLPVTATIGLFGATVSFRAVFALLQGRKNILRPRECARRVLVVSLCFLGTCYAIVAFINIYVFLFEPSTGHIFGSRFWMWRSLWMDVPYDFLNLAIVPAIMLHYVD